MYWSIGLSTKPIESVVNDLVGLVFERFAGYLMNLDRVEVT
jgi:hypothetical protein